MLPDIKTEEPLSFNLMEPCVWRKGTILGIMMGHSKHWEFDQTPQCFSFQVLKTGVFGYNFQGYFFFVPKFQYILLDILFSSQLFSRPSHTIHTLSSGYFQIVSLAWFFVELLVVSEASDICSVDHGEPWTLYTFKRRPTGTYFLRIWPSVSLISLFWSWRAWIISSLLRVELL